MPISENIKKLRQIFDVTQDELGEWQLAIK